MEIKADATITELNNLGLCARKETRMKQRMSTILVVLLAAMLLMVAGCDLSLDQDGTGGLAISLGSSSRNLVWEPELDMDVASYTISGAGPTTEDSFEVSGYTEGLFTRDDLAVGEWTITVDGYNTDGDKIATAEANVTIVRNETTAVTMVLRSLEGTGTLSVSMSWTDSQGLLADPVATVVVRDEEGGDIETISDPVSLTVDGQSASAEVTDLPTGWYEVTVNLSDGSATAWQGVFALRVVADQTTTGTVVISEDQFQIGPGVGIVSITIEEDMDDPLVVGFSGMPESVEAGTEITLTSTGAYSGAEQYRWYVNGVRQTDETTSSFTYTLAEVGTYTISLLVHDAGALGGYGESVAVVEATTEYTVGDLGPSGGYVFYENPDYATDGWRYMEAAPAGWSGGSEDPTKVWGGYGTAVESGTGTAIGTGSSNTQKIVATFGNAEPYESKTDYAAKLCADYRGGGYDDWFLPSKDELNLMYQNLKVQNLGGVSDDVYWSSSEYNTGAWGQGFSDGYQGYGSRYNDYGVRPVRAF
jgi:hypothetical protein